VTLEASAKGRALLAGCVCLMTVAVGGVAFAAGERPAISGDPVVGNTLTSSLGPTGQALYKWQSCDPDVADCSDSPDHNDPNWTDLTGESHTGLAYTIPANDLGHFIRVLIHDNNLGDHWATSPPVGPVTEGKRSSPPPPLEPEHGISFLVQPAGGSVKIKPPGQSGYTPLDGLEKIPVGSIVDTRGGTVQVTAATGDLGDTTEDNKVRLWDGLVRLEQGPDHNALASAKLVEKLRCPKNNGVEAKAGKSSGGPVATTSRKRRRRVWGSGSGSYSTSGGGGTGSVRGTTWLTKDTCRGTFFKVTDGIGITVHDSDLNQNFDLGPGQSYFARNR
jgi:hypothetical protein